MASLRKTLFNQLLDIEDLSYLSRLMENGLSLSECFSLLKTRRNEAMFEQIQKRLNQGELIEKVIGDYLPRKIRSYMASFLDSLSFQETLSLSLRFYEKKRRGQKDTAVADRISSDPLVHLDDCPVSFRSLWH